MYNHKEYLNTNNSLRGKQKCFP